LDIRSFLPKVINALPDMDSLSRFGVQAEPLVVIQATYTRTGWSISPSASTGMTSPSSGCFGAHLLARAPVSRQKRASTRLKAVELPEAHSSWH